MPEMLSINALLLEMKNELTGIDDLTWHHEVVGPHVLSQELSPLVNMYLY